MESTHELSVGELLEQLLADSLIDACQISGESLTIVQGENRHSFPYDQAHTFLTGMLRGRTWNLKPSEAAGAANANEAASPRVTGDADPTIAVTASPGPSAAESADQNLPADQNLRGDPSEAGRTPTLESLLSMARDLGLIEEWEHDVGGASVTIALPACRTQLQRDEAMIYLSDCILHRLETIREEVARLIETTGGVGGPPEPDGDASDGADAPDDVDAPDEAPHDDADAPDAAPHDDEQRFAAPSSEPMWKRLE